MVTPQPQPQQTTFYAARPVSLVRVLFFVAFACALIAALIFGSVVSQPMDAGLAWLAGGFAASWLAMAV